MNELINPFEEPELPELPEIDEPVLDEPEVTPPINDGTINREQLIEDSFLWLPSGNILSEIEMLKIAEFVIRSVGDDEKNYPEVLCKFLAAVANVNKGKAAVDNVGIAKEELGSHKITYSGIVDYSKVWNDFIKSLENICPLFGYSPKRKTTARINAGEKYNPLSPY